jgi:pyridoxine 5'-phosphate synthase PdxJ
MAIESGADGITAHLREDRRHIRDEDMKRLKAEISKPLNFEMAATAEMLQIALATKPHAVCLVPERRTEVTTEGDSMWSDSAMRWGLSSRGSTMPESACRCSSRPIRRRSKWPRN